MTRSFEFHSTNYGCPNPNFPQSNGDSNSRKACGCSPTAAGNEDPLLEFNEKYTKSQRCKSTADCGGKKRSYSPHLSVSRFFVQSLARSSISGVNHVASSKSSWAKMRWSVILFICLCGFGYQAFSFARIYNSRPSSVVIDVDNHGDTEFPSVTFCNTNRIRKSEYCKTFPPKCENGSENLSITERQINDLMLMLLKKNKTDVRKQLGHSESMIVSCTFDGRPHLNQTECIRSLEYFYDPDLGNCFTIPSTTKQGERLKAREADFWQEANDLSVLVNIESAEYMEVKRDPGMWATAHAGSYEPDIHTDGQMIEAGYFYTIGLQKTTVHFLPLPYKTNCTDYMELPWAKSKRITSRMCTIGCSQHLQLKSCGYVTPDLGLFYDNLPFDPSIASKEQKACAQDEEENSKAYCRSLCGIPCTDAMYEVTLGSTLLTEGEIRDHLPPDIMQWEWEQKRKNLALLRIYYKTLEHKIFRHMPKYNTMELFSYLGGYSGVWLGFSLLTVYELLEILFDTARFAMFKFQRHRQQKKFVDAFFAAKFPSKAANKGRKKKSQSR